MSLVLGVLGACLIALGVFDQLMTVANVETSGGVVTGRLLDWTWRGALRLHGRRGSHRFLRLAGVGLLTMTVLTWVGLLWVGWSLVFLSDDNAVLTTDQGVPASGWARVYYVGYTIFTLGNGEYRAGSAPWQLATTAAALSGVALVALAVSYFVPVVQAVTQKRQIAALVAALGGTPSLILERAWTGKAYRGLDAHLVNLTLNLALVRQNHYAYPALHYFHSLETFDAFAPRLAALDEALTVLVHAVPLELRPEPSAVEPVRHVIRSLLDTLEKSFISASSVAPPLLDLDELRQRGLPFLDDQAVVEALETEDERRRLLRGLIEHDGWRWAESVWMDTTPTGGATVGIDPADHMHNRTEASTP